MSTENNWQIIKEYIKSNSNNGNFNFNYNEENPFVIAEYGWLSIEGFNKWLAKEYPNVCKEIGQLRDKDDDKWLGFLTDGDWGFSDEWSFCADCKEPIHMIYEPHWINIDEILCEDCVREEHAEDYINEHLVINWELGVPSTNIPLNQVLSTETLKEHGFSKVKEGLEAGMYGTYDDPVKILRELTENNRHSDFVVHCTDINPYATNYEIWERVNESEVSFDN